MAASFPTISSSLFNDYHCLRIGDFKCHETIRRWLGFSWWGLNAISNEQDRRSTYNVTLRCVCAINPAVKK